MAKNQQGKGGFADNPKLASEAGKKGGQAKTGKGGNQKSSQKS
jgi:general stress protein YciG